MEKNSRRGESGQIGVIILLIMVVLMTIGLSVASRTTQDLAISQQSAESTRVFNAAEAGIEEALSTDLTAAQDGSTTTVSNFDSDRLEVSYTVNKVEALETRVFEGTTVMVDVTGAVTGQSIRLEWSHENDCSTEAPASLYVAVYSVDPVDPNVVNVKNYGIGSGCSHSDNFTSGTTINNDGYRRSYVLSLTTNDSFVRIKPVYNDTHLRVTGVGWTLPVQYFNIRSEARSGLGDEARTVEVNRTLPTAPSFMDFTVYSGTTVLK
jgi:hypothetical protein